MTGKHVSLQPEWNPSQGIASTDIKLQESDVKIQPPPTERARLSATLENQTKKKKTHIHDNMEIDRAT